MLLKDIELKQEFKRLVPDATAAEAIALIAEYHTPIILVEKGGPGDTHGVITKRDIIGKLIGEGLDPEKVSAGDLASKPLIVINNIEVDVCWVARIMAREKVSCVGIYDRGEFKGFVTDRDILTAMAAGLKDEGRRQA